MRPRGHGPSNGNRWRQEGMPGGWLWVVILMVLVGILYFTLELPSAGMIDYPQFMEIAEEGLFTTATIIGNDRAVGEVNKEKWEKANVSEEVRNQARGVRLVTNIPGGAQRIPNMTADLDKAHVPYRQDQEPGTWVGPVVMMLLPIVIILAIFFFFLLPRFRERLQE